MSLKEQKRKHFRYHFHLLPLDTDFLWEHKKGSGSPGTTYFAILISSLIIHTVVTMFTILVGANVSNFQEQSPQDSTSLR